MIFLALFSSCQEEYEYGTIVEPTNIVINYQIKGADDQNPNGDGSGEVYFSVTADHSLSYVFNFDGEEVVSPSGVYTKLFSIVGLNTYSVGVTAIGTAGVMSSKTIHIDVLSLYEPPEELTNMLYGTGSKTWRVMAEFQGAQGTDGHFGLGPLGGDKPFEWYSAGANEKSSSGMYDDRFTFRSDGTFTHDTGADGGVYGKQAVLDRDFGVNPDAVEGCCEEWNLYPLPTYSGTWALSAPNDQETISLSGDSFIAFYAGTHVYQFFEYTENRMVISTQSVDTGFAWWFMLIAD